MKIITGKFKGRNLFMPKDIRPSQNILRKAIFDLLGQDFAGLEFLELYAGSGAVGFEAMSCGAKKVTFVETNPKCIQVIERNLALLEETSGGEPLGQCEIINTDAFIAIKQLAQARQKFDIVFLDPPFGHDLAKKTLKTLMAYDILHPDCFIIVQYHKHEFLPKLEGGFSLIRERKYGTSFLAIFQRLPAGSEVPNPDPAGEHSNSEP